MPVEEDHSCLELASQVAFDEPEGTRAHNSGGLRRRRIDLHRPRGTRGLHGPQDRFSQAPATKSKDASDPIHPFVAFPRISSRPGTGRPNPRPSRT